MTKQTISVQRALGELKILDSRILRAAADGRYTTYLKGGKTVRGNKTKDEFAKEAKANLESATALIARRRAIKSAIVQSNATTKITVAGVELTVAEAIEMKESIQLEEQLVRHLRQDLARSKQVVEIEQQKYDNELKTRIDALLGKDAQKDSDLAGEVESISKQFEKNNAVTLHDPANIEAFIEAKLKDIEDFKNNIDILLLESNVATMIEIEG